MAKYSCDEMLDPGLSYLRANTDKMFVCSAYPTTYTEASSTYVLASVDIELGYWTGPYSDVDNGRVLGLKSFFNVIASGTGQRNHVAFCNSTQTKIIHVTECTNEYMESGANCYIPETAITYPQPI